MDNLKPGDIKIYRIISKNNFINSGTLLRSFLTCKSGDSCSITFRISLLEIEPTLEDFKYISHERKSFIIPVQQKMLEEDYFDNKRKKKFTLGEN